MDIDSEFLIQSLAVRPAWDAIDVDSVDEVVILAI